MHHADLHHKDKTLQAKLEEVFQLRRTKSAVNWDRAQYFELLDKFGNPHKSLPPVIHVAGTNGKGSIIAMMRSMLEAQGYNVHVYTSPHLIHVNERIVLNGQEIDDTYLERLLDQALAYNDGAPLSFFEITTAMAFRAFADSPADILLLEVGMGGRLDCTSVIDSPLLTIINRISMDHTDFLGETIEEIAAEKAGIMRSGVPCIVGHQGSSDQADVIMGVLKSHARKLGVPLCRAAVNWQVGAAQQEGAIVFTGKESGRHQYPAPALEGAHQMNNAGVALAALEAIQKNFPVSDRAKEQGLQTVNWAGRLQRLEDDALGVFNEIWLDAGHNDSAGAALASQIETWSRRDRRPIHLITGLLGTKKADMFLAPMLEKISGLHVVPITGDPTSQSLDAIMESINQAHHSNLKVSAHDTVFEAVKVIARSAPDARILIAGSVYLAGEVLQRIRDCE